MNDVMHDAQELFEYTQFLRRDFHRHPELGFQETRTSGIVARELEQLGLSVTTGIGRTGVVGLLEGDQPGPVLLIRFDMDALPIQEETGTEYTSTNAGVMHACGHDGHVAVGLTTARLLAAQRKELHGTVKFMFQPAEEGLGGAESMLQEGVLENPHVDMALSMHLWNERETGWVGVTSGPLMAGAEIFQVKIEGKGGHGALPHATIDPLVAAAQIVSSLQSVVARNVSPLEAAVVSVCTMKAGEAFNVIPKEATLSGTIRTFQPAVRTAVIARFVKLVEGVAEAYGCTAQIDMQRLTPAVINNAQMAGRLSKVTAKLAGLTVEENYQSMVSEDMAFVLEQVPGVYLMIGSANAERGLNYGHHHPCFDFEEAAMVNGAAVMAACAMELLR